MRSACLITTNLGGGGAENVCVTVANALVKKGWEVNIVVLNLNEFVFDARFDKRIKIWDLKVKHARNSFFALKRILKNLGTHKVLVFNPELSSVLVILKKLRFINTYIISRNINTVSRLIVDPSINLRSRIVNKIIFFFFKHSDYIINQCFAMQDDLLALFPSLSSRSKVIYNPVNESYLVKKKIISYNNDPYLLLIGRLERQKGIHYALNAFASIHKKYKELRFKIVGVGSEEQNLKSLVKGLGIDCFVDFEGFCPDPTNYYLNAKGTILTSFYEGFPNVLIESITLGTPVIAFDCPSGPAEIIQSNNGILVNYLNQQELNGALDSFLQKEFDYKKVRESAKIFSVKNIIEQYERLLI